MNINPQIKITFDVGFRFQINDINHLDKAQVAFHNVEILCLLIKNIPLEGREKTSIWGRPFPATQCIGEEHVKRTGKKAILQ